MAEDIKPYYFVERNRHWFGNIDAPEPVFDPMYVNDRQDIIELTGELLNTYEGDGKIGPARTIETVRLTYNGKQWYHPIGTAVVIIEGRPNRRNYIWFNTAPLEGEPPAGAAGPGAAHVGGKRRNRSSKNRKLQRQKRSRTARRTRR